MTERKLEVERTFAVDICAGGIIYVDDKLYITQLSARDACSELLGCAEVKKQRKPRKAKVAMPHDTGTPTPKPGRPKKITVQGTDGKEL